jgi:nitroreductase
MKTVNNRKTEYDINDVFLNRYSPRAMSGEAVSKQELMILLEAARWAPSSMNAQPWRFIYTMKGSPDFDLFLPFIFEKNRIWSKNASALIVVISKNNLDDGSFSIPHSFDTGAACENLALQVTKMGLVSHAMGGIDKNIVKKELEISDDYTVEIMIAIGKPGKIDDLPEALREREKPSDRKALAEISFEGKEGAKKL